MSEVLAAAPAKRRGDLATRAATGGAMIAVALAALWIGGQAFLLLATAAALLMTAEWCGLMRARRWQVTLALVLAGGCMLLVGQAMLDLRGLPIAPPSIGQLALWCGGAAILLGLISRNAGIGAGLAYAALPAMALVYLRAEHGLVLTLWTLALVWATDIGAYFAGRAIGGPRLAPRFSPNKTWAGLVGGMVAAAVLGGALSVTAGLPSACRWLAAPLAVLAQMGDLFESWLKRRAGVKDSGRLLPGHGGALDRLDGVVPVAMLVAALAAGGGL